MAMPEMGLYLDRYATFLRERWKAKGYEFQQGATPSIPPPKVTFADRLRWWTINRTERLKKIRAERDRCVQEIVQLKPPSAPKNRMES